jgi:UDP-N-acetylglucosamine acyltransferase
MIVEGSPAEVRGVNLVGLRRAGVPTPTRDALRQACRYMFFSEMNLTQAIERIRAEIDMSAELEYLIEFMEQIRHGRNGRALDQPTRK